MKKVEVLITRAFKPDLLATLDDLSEKLVLRQEKLHSPEDLATALNKHPEAEVLYSINTPKIWSPHWNLRWIQNHYAGINHIYHDAIPDHVILTTASGTNSITMAEHTFALILTLRRRIPQLLDFQHKHTWPEKRWKKFAQPLLRGKTMGILGYGSIGREIARLAKAFGMRVLAYKRNPDQTRDSGFTIPGTGDPDGSIPTHYYGADRLYEILKASDIVVNVLPATGETEGLLDEKAFAAMKPSSIFISVGRGKTVDENALIEAIKGGDLAGAGLDVFATEPLPASSPLWHLNNVIISPHVGGSFDQYDEFCMILFRENLARYLAGKPLLNRVNRKLGY